MTDGAIKRKRWKNIITLMAGMIVLYTSVNRIQSGGFRVDDFVGYWAAGRALLDHDNPYSLEKILSLQKSAGWTGDVPLPVWTPPWSLFLLVPFGMLSYPTGRFIWLIVNLALVILCADWAWRFYGGTPRYRWISWLVSLTFLPTLTALSIGQIGPIILAGIASFLYFEKRQQLWLAGIATVLIAIKPHLLYLVWISVVVWALDRRRWSLLLSGGLAGLLVSLVPWTFDRGVFPHYFSSMSHSHFLENQWPTLGALLRLLFGWEHKWLQFLPSIMGTIWFLLHWRANRQAWDWHKQMPIMLLVSVATAFYGWMFDQVVLLPAVIQGAVWIFQSPSYKALWSALAVYLVLIAMALAVIILQLNSIWLVWMGPAWVLFYWSLQSKRELIGEQVGPLSRGIFARDE